MPNPQKVFKNMKKQMNETRQLFILQVNEATKKARLLANDVSGVIGEISIAEAKAAVLEEFKNELMK